ncbi:MAG TPA: MBL fold metallo-hydrolase [Candidatus Acidoferrum sp.]|nr:MBL fold metallo-hydrolase [Candidatus Acidoferrum sp.]
MYELVRLTDRSFYIDNPSKVGVWLDGETCYLIDSGNDKDAARKIAQVVEREGWVCGGIILTHSNADHMGGAAALSARLHAPVYATGTEAAVALHPILEPSLLYGGRPFAQLRNKFLMAKPLDKVLGEPLPAGLQYIPLPGHYLEMAGVMTPDRVFFAADCLFGENIIDKYHLSYVLDPGLFIETLKMLPTLEADWFVPSHAPAARDIAPLAEKNIKKVEEIISVILGLCEKPQGFDDLLEAVFTHFGLTMDFDQYVLVGSTLRNYLSWLSDEGRLVPRFEGARLFWGLPE